MRARAACAAADLRVELDGPPGLLPRRLAQPGLQQHLGKPLVLGRLVGMLLRPAGGTRPGPLSCGRPPGGGRRRAPARAFTSHGPPSAQLLDRPPQGVDFRGGELARAGVEPERGHDRVVRRLGELLADGGRTVRAGRCRPGSARATNPGGGTMRNSIWRTCGSGSTSGARRSAAGRLAGRARRGPPRPCPTSSPRNRPGKRSKSGSGWIATVASASSKRPIRASADLGHHAERLGQVQRRGVFQPGQGLGAVLLLEEVAPRACAGP